VLCRVGLGWAGLALHSSAWLGLACPGVEWTGLDWTICSTLSSSLPRHPRLRTLAPLHSPSGLPISGTGHRTGSSVEIGRRLFGRLFETSEIPKPPKPPKLPKLPKPPCLCLQRTLDIADGLTLSALSTPLTRMGVAASMTPKSRLFGRYHSRKHRIPKKSLNRRNRDPSNREAAIPSCRETARRRDGEIARL
jgi:hypothetical protein